jgi:hypothetical protein
VLDTHGLRAPAGRHARHRFYTSGEPRGFGEALLRLTGLEGVIVAARWHGDRTLTESGAAAR